METQPNFSLVIPCYNEAESLPSLIQRVDFLAKITGGEIILVDNGSTDETEGVLEELLGENPLVRSIRIEKNEGYGNGIVSGLYQAKSNVIGWTHADLQSDPLDVIRALKLVHKDEEFFIKGFRHGRGFTDTFFSSGMSFVESMLFGKILREVNAQPTLFDKKLLATWDQPPKDFSIDLYALISAKKANRKVLRIPVLFPPREFGASSWNDGVSARIRLSKRTIAYSIRLRFRTSKVNKKDIT